MTETSGNIPLFNNPLETGLRALIILDEAYPREFDLSSLVWLDYIVVHTGDFGGLTSLHPDIPARSGELLVRRSIIEEGLLLMRQIHLVRLNETNNGIFYTTTDYARPVIGLLYENYNIELKKRAKWLINMVNGISENKLRHKIDKQMGLWNIEFQVKERYKYEQ